MKKIVETSSSLDFYEMIVTIIGYAHNESWS